VVDAFALVTALARRADPRIAEPPVFDADPVRASYEAAAVAPIGPLDAQRLLATRDAGARLALLADLVEERVVDLRARLDLDE
jgi:Lon protease-like protein